MPDPRLSSTTTRDQPSPEAASIRHSPEERTAPDASGVRRDHLPVGNRLSDDDRLLLLLSRGSLGTGQRQEAKSLLEATLRKRSDPGAALLTSAAQHAILPQVWTHLTTFDDVVPADLLAHFRTGYLIHFRKSLHVRAACAPVLSDLKSHGVRALAFKGPVIAQMAYADPNMRVCTDLDLLIDKRDVPSALSALDKMGFEPRNPLQPDYDDRWSIYLPHHRPHGNANGYARGSGTPDALHIDLHWGFASRYLLFPWRPADAWPHQQTIPLPDGTAIPTLSDADTLLFLCMHAVKDSYDRLRLVRDIAGLLHHRQDLDSERTMRTATEHGGARMLALGISLAECLYHAPVPQPLRAFSRRHCPRDLVDRALTLLFRPRRGVSGLLQRSIFHLKVRDRTQDALGTVLYQTELSAQTWLRRHRVTSEDARS